MLEMAEAEFEELVVDAIDGLAPEVAAMLDNVALFVEDDNADEPDLLGLYDGIPLTERRSSYLMTIPDRITVYRLPLLDMCADLDELRHEVQVTVVHEIAHHFGIDDERLHDLGYS